MIKNKNSINKKKKTVSKQTDSTYILKLVLYLILGSMWLRIHNGEASVLPLPVGLVIGLLFASHDHFLIDRKIEYALLLLATFLGFWLPMGINIVL